MSWRLEKRDLSGQWILKEEEIHWIIHSLKERIRSSKWLNYESSSLQNLLLSEGREWHELYIAHNDHKVEKSNSKRFTPRLQAVADLHPRNTVNIDIGTDHAHLPILLVRSNISPLAFGVDVASAPLQIAQRALAKASMNGRIALVHGDGIQPFIKADTLRSMQVQPLSVDDQSRWEIMRECAQVTVTICGVGGLLAAELISTLPQWVNALIIQANDHPEAVDQALHHHQTWFLTKMSATVDRNRLFISKLALRQKKPMDHSHINVRLWRWILLSRAVRRVSMTPQAHKSFGDKMKSLDRAVKYFFCKD